MYRQNIKNSFAIWIRDSPVLFLFLDTLQWFDIIKKNDIHKFQNILIIINQYEIARLYHTFKGICLAWLIIIPVYNLRDNINVTLWKQNKCQEHESI